MVTHPSAPVPAVVSFVDRVNHGDTDGLAALLTEDHELVVLGEPPVVGRAANLAAWRGYSDAFPAYLIHPHQVTERAGRVAVLGHTTGSHLGLPDEEEAQELLIWVGEVRDGLLRSWHIHEDRPALRRELGLLPDPPLTDGVPVPG